MNATIQGQAEYRDKFGTFRYRVQIVDADEATENIREYEIAPEGVVYTYEGDQENGYQPIITSTASFTLLCTTTAQVQFIRDLAESEVGQYGVRILRASGNSTPTSTYWVGVIIADQIEFSDSLPLAVTITATDGLGYLNNVPYLDGSGNRYTGEVTLLEHVTNALRKLHTTWYWEYFITIVGTDFYPIALSFGRHFDPDTYGTAGGNNDLINESKLTHTAFYDNGEFEAKSAYYVLEEILKHLNSSLFVTHDVQATRFCIQPTGAQIKYATDASALGGSTWRTDNANYQTSPLPFATQTITNTGGNYYRLSGGKMSYAQPYKTVTREVKYLALDFVAQAGQYEYDDFNTVYSTAFEPQAGDRYRIVANSYCSWFGVASAESILFNTTGSSGTAPLNYHIGRIRYRLRVQFEVDSANDYYLKRNLTAGGQVPLYELYGDVTSSDLPIYYTNLYPAVTQSWDNSGTPYYYVIVSDPFDTTLAQNISLPIDIVTPEVPANCVGIKLYAEIQYLLPDNSEATFFSSGDSLLDSSLANVYSNVRLYPFNGYGLDDGATYTATNTADNRKTLDIGTSSVNDNGQSSNFGAVKYRQPNGSYSYELLGYTSTLSASSVYPAAKLAVQEVAQHYDAPRFTFEGDLINVDFDLNTALSIVDNVTTYKLKPLELTVNTGQNIVSVVAMELAAATAVPPVDFLPNGTFDPPTPPPTPDLYAGLSLTTRTISEQVQPVITAYTDADATNRSGQTGEKVVTIDTDGKFQEITDGTSRQILRTNGSGSYSFASETILLASFSARATVQYTNTYYYGNSAYGWAYPIWSSISFNNQVGNPFKLQISDDYAHCAVVTSHDLSSVSATGTIRNDSSTDNLDVILAYGDPPNGSASNIQLTELDTTDVTITYQDRHYNFNVSGSDVPRGKLLVIGVGRTAGTSPATRYANFSVTITGTLK